MKNKNYLKLNPKFIFRLFSLLILIVACSLNSFGQVTQTFTSSGTFTVPAGVTSITVSAWGGGGAGGGVDGQTKAGGGGEGGSFVRGTITVVPGATYTVVVGSGGLGVVAANGGSGQPSSFSVGGGGATLFNAIGGVYGAVGSSFGAGGNATNTGNIVSGTSTSNFYGGNGGNATSSSSASSGGGGGSAGAGGNGGNGGSPLTGGTAGLGSGTPSDPGVVGATGRGSSNDGNGNNGGAPGAGGSGGRNANNTTDYRGGNGGNGQISVIWTCPSYALTAISGVTPICNSVGTSTITLTGSASGLPVGTYTVTYDRSVPSATNLTAAMTVITAGTGSFSAAGLTTGGSSTITVKSLTSGATGGTCSSTISTNNTSAITVNATPTISVQPSSQGICPGSPVTFNVTGTSNPTPTYQWKKAGIDISGATNSSFNIASVSAGDVDPYTVVLTNLCGSLTSSGAALTLNTEPSISVHPSSQTKCTGTSVTFSVTASGTPTPTYQWRKDGVNISGAISASYNIASVAIGSAADYDVVVTNTCGTAASTAAVLTVNVSPTANASNNGPICSGNTLNLSSNSTGVTYSWSGPASFSSTLQSPSRPNALTTYGGTYTITITDIVNGCTASTTTGATVNATPATIASNNSAICAGATLNLTGGPASQTTYSWVGPNGYTSSSQSPSRSNAQTSYSGTYTLTVTSSAGCSASASTTATVNATPVASASNNGPVCQGSNLSLSASGGASYSWSGPNSYSSTSQNPSITAIDGGHVGTYTVTVTQTGCTATASTVFSSIKPLPLPAPAVAPGTVCSGSAISLTSKQEVKVGNVNDFNIPNVNSTGITSQIPMSGFAPATLAASTIKSVNFNISHTQDGDLEIILIAPNGTSILLVNNRGGSGDNFTNTTIVNSGGANGNVSAGSAPFTGTYNTETAFSGLTGNANGTWGLKVVDNTSSFNSGTLLNWTLTLVSNGVTYNWSSSPAGFSSALQNPTGNPLQNTTYIVDATLSGCIASGSVAITTMPIPEPDASTNAPICSTSGLFLFGNNNAIGQTTGNTWSWKNPNNVIFSTSQNPSINNATIANTGNYTLTVTNSNGCTASATTQAIVNPNPVLSIGTQTNVSCNGLSDGTVSLVATDGTLPYLYDLEGNLTVNGIYGGLVAGNYFASVTDDNGCQVTSALNVVITQPAVLSFNASSINESCLGSANGSVTISATGGTADYQYSIDNGLNFQNLNSFTNLSVGNYDLVVKDAHNCITASAPAAILTTPDVTPPVIINTPVSISKCIDLAPVNWTAPVATDNCTTPVLTSNHNPGEVFPVGVTTVVYTADDGNGNTSTSSFDVTVNPLPTAIISNNNTICIGGSAQLHIDFTGTGPWNYVVSNGSQNISGTALNSSHDFLVTPPTYGEHNYSIISVSDANCTGTSSGTVLVKVLPAPPPQNIISAVNAPVNACNGDVILITASTSGGQEVSYSWNQGSSSMTALFSENIGGPFTAGPLLTALPQVYAQFVASGGWSGYYICVKAVNACGNTINKCKWVRGVVNVPGPISPATQVVACPGDIMNYSCGASNGATVYNWTLNGSPASISPNGGNNTSVQVTFPPAFTSGQLCVTASLACQGSSISAPRCINIYNNPARPTIISGVSAACPGTTGVSYSVQAVPGASGYNWTVPANATIATGVNSHSITVDFPTPFTGSHSVCVTATSACGASAAKCKTVVSGIPNKPASITGPLTNICGSTVQYSVVNPQANLTYAWTNPVGTTISGSASGSTILLNVSPTFTNGFLTVVANSALCAPETSAPRTSSTIWGRPNNPGIITANPDLWCSGGYVNFSVTPAAPLPTYTWTVSNGTIDAGQGSNNIDMTWGTNVAGTVSVRASNGCGISAGTSSQSFSSACREEAINTSSEVDFSVYPNPAQDNVTLNFNSIEKENVHIGLIDLSGRALHTVIYDADKGMNKVMIDLKKFSKGAYIVQIKSDKLHQQLPIILQ